MTRRKTKKINKIFRRTRSKQQKGGSGTTPLPQETGATPSKFGGKRKTRKSTNKKKNKKTRSKKQKGGTTQLEMFSAANNGDLKTIEEALNNGVDVNSINLNGTTVLMIASLRGYTEIVKLLLENGADVNSFDNENDTALIRATFAGHADIVEMLLDAGADMNKLSNDSGTALMTASMFGYIDILKMLLDRGADVNVSHHWNGKTALMVAVENGFINIVPKLLEKGADIYARDNDGNTAQMLAEENWDEDKIDSLNNYILERKQNVINPIVLKTEQRQKNRIQFLKEARDLPPAVREEGMEFLGGKR
jgi:ankyrin repeat protein